MNEDPHHPLLQEIPIIVYDCLILVVVVSYPHFYCLSALSPMIWGLFYSYPCQGIAKRRVRTRSQVMTSARAQSECSFLGPSLIPTKLCPPTPTKLAARCTPGTSANGMGWYQGSSRKAMYELCSDSGMELN